MNRLNPEGAQIFSRNKMSFKLKMTFMQQQRILQAE